MTPRTGPAATQADECPLPGMTGRPKRQRAAQPDFECPVCHAAFASLKDFDQHRKGER